MSSTKRMAFKVIDRLFVVVYGTEEPTNEEWTSYLREIERQGVERTMQIIYTNGGGPNAVQRRYLEELLDGRVVPVAVLSDIASIRRMVMAMSWFNGKIRAFPTTDLARALAYLEIPTSRTELIGREMAALRISVGR